MSDAGRLAEPDLAGRRAAALARNATANAGRYGIAALLALAVTPYALHVLGPDRFGLWAVAGSVLTMSRLLDLGLHRSLTRAVATAAARGRPGSAAAAFGSGRAVLLLLGAAVLLAVWCARAPLTAGLLRLPAERWPEAYLVLVGTAAVATIEAAFAPFQAALDGLGRMDLSAGTDTLQRILSSLGTVVVLALGWGLAGLVAKNMVTALLAGVAYWLLVRGRAPELAALRPRLDLALARSLLGFGGHIQTVNLGPLVVEVGAKVLLSRVVGLGAVAVYELAVRVTSQVGGALLAAALAVFPTAAGVHAAEEGAAVDTGALATLYQRVTRRLGTVTWGAYALLIALAAPFATAWLGPGQLMVGWSIAVLGVGGLLAVPATPAYLVAQAGGRQRISTAASLATVAVALVGATGLVGRWGLAGVVVGVALGLAAGGIAIWWLFARAFGTGWATVGCLGWRGPLAGLCGGLAAWAAAAVLPPHLAGVAVAALVGCGVWLTALIGTGELGAAERAVLRRVLSGGARGAA